MQLKTNVLKKLFLPLLLALLLIVIACNKDDDSPIQTGYVNIVIYPNSVEYLELNSPGGYVYLNANEPSRGILVYRLNNEDFNAFERTPTHKQDSCCTIINEKLKCTAVLVDESGLFVDDTCTGSRWLILDGTVQKGPATRPLYKYQTIYDGNSLRIYN
jgi:hypothetical protein